MRALLILLAGLLLAPFIAAGMFCYGWWSYHLLERSIVEKMDQYYLNITTPNREEYLLESDEVFEVPYMASRLSVTAVPTRIYDSAGRLIGEFASEKALYVRDPDDVPSFLKKALVATEDGTFYAHHGINYRATARAMLAATPASEPTGMLGSMPPCQRAQRPCRSGVLTARRTRSS